MAEATTRQAISIKTSERERERERKEERETVGFCSSGLGEDHAKEDEREDELFRRGNDIHSLVFSNSFVPSEIFAHLLAHLLSAA